MTTLLVLGLMFLGAVLSLVLIPLLLLKVAFVLTMGLIVIPFKIVGALVGGLARGLFKGLFWMALLLIPLAIIAFPFTIMAGGAWLVYRALHPRPAHQPYVVS